MKQSPSVPRGAAVRDGARWTATSGRGQGRGRVLGGASGRPKNGIGIFVRPTDNPDSPEVGIADIGAGRWLATFPTPFEIGLNQFVEIRIEDDGSRIAVYADEQFVGEWDTDVDYGDTVHLVNRARIADHITEIDWLEIGGLRPVLDLKANGSDELLVLGPGEPLTLAADLVTDPAVTGDTWVLALTPFHPPFHFFIYRFDRDAWVPWLQTGYGPSQQGAIPQLDAEVLLDTDGLPAGFYTFFLGYDTTENRRIDFDDLALDAVPVLTGN